MLSEVSPFGLSDHMSPAFRHISYELGFGLSIVAKPAKSSGFPRMESMPVILIISCVNHGCLALTVGSGGGRDDDSEGRRNYCPP